MEAKAQQVAKELLGSPDIVRLNEVFQKKGKEIRLVGGAVRDIMLGSTPKDIDLATTALPEEAQTILEAEGIRCVATGLQHGTVTAVLNGINYEITTLRIDTATDGRWATVKYTDDWRLDALRRDLTVNAMSLDMGGTLHDYFDGLAHLHERRVLFVGEALQRIQEDYLRILRYFRFHGRLSHTGEHDPTTIAAITECAPGLERISGERVWQEMSKILPLPSSVPLLHTMLVAGVLRHISLGHVDSRSIAALAEAKRSSTDPIALLVALVPGEEKFIELTTHWHLANKEKFLGNYIIEHRAQNMTKEMAEDEVVNKVPAAAVAELLRYQNKPDLAAHIASWPAPAFPITGKELKAHGVPAGPTMGLVLTRLKTIWIHSRFTLTAASLLRDHLPALLAEVHAGSA